MSPATDTRRSTGTPLVQVPDDTWVYASGLTQNGKTKPSAVKAEKKAPKGTPKRLRPDTEAAAEIPASPPGGTFSGTQRSLVLLVDFPNRPPVGTVAADWNARFFGPTASVADYYDEASYGSLALTPATESNGTVNDGVVGWLTMPYDHPDTAGATGRRTRRLTKDAILAADPYVNFAAYDTNGDGKIEARELHVTVIVAGYETSYGGPSVQCGPSTSGPQVGRQRPWRPRHRSASRSAAGCQTPCTATRSSASGAAPPTWDPPGHAGTIGIIAHEIGHDLGWPDLYDVDQSSNGIGEWSLMASGSWTPPGTTTWVASAGPARRLSRSYQGWSTPVEITGSVTNVPITAANVADSVKRLGANPGGWTGPSAAPAETVSTCRSRTGRRPATTPACRGAASSSGTSETRTSASPPTRPTRGTRRPRGGGRPGAARRQVEPRERRRSLSGIDRRTTCSTVRATRTPTGTRAIRAA